MNKFILRKARALSFNMYTIEEGLKCIQEFKVQELKVKGKKKIDKNLRDLTKALETELETKLKQINGDYDIFTIYS